MTLTLEELIIIVKELQEENARMRKRISILEGHLGINEDAYFDLIDQEVTPFCEHVKQLQEKSTKTDYENQKGVLQEELYKKRVIHTKEVMALFGFKHYEQAKRLMKKLSDENKQFIFENPHGKTYRLLYVNNVYTNKALNNMFKQD